MKFTFLTLLPLFLLIHSLSAVDTDGDGLDDSVESNTGVYISETNTGTDPNNADTDGDSIKDGLEVSYGSDPHSDQSPLWDYEVSYRSPRVPESEQYVFSKDNIQFRSESTSISYWCPISTDSPATLTQKFIFNGESESVFLNLHYLYIANFSSGNYGSGEIYASTDGENWELILDGPRPSSIAGNYVYHEYLPSSLLGTNELWIQTRLQASGWNIMAQYLRYNEGRPYNCFDLKVSYHDLDADSDGLSDSVETNTGIYISETDTGTDPNIADTDGDGVSDGLEITEGTDPNDIDSDDDTLLDGVETNTGTWVSASDAGTDPLSNDSDSDGLSDSVETNTGIYFDSSDTGTSPLLADSDYDGIQDNYETASGVWQSANNTGTDPNRGDTDNDGIIDGRETNTGNFVSLSDTGTDPNNTDSDGDGFTDKFEIDTSYDPTSSDDTPDAYSFIETAVEVNFYGANGGTYRIEHTEDLESGIWATVENGIEGSSELIERLYSTDDYSRRFFRVVRTDQ